MCSTVREVAERNCRIETGRLIFVDAQAVEAAQAQALAQGRSIVSPPTAEDDAEMAAFQSMLKEYLSRKCRLAVPLWVTEKLYSCGLG